MGIRAYAPWPALRRPDWRWKTAGPSRGTAAAPASGESPYRRMVAERHRRAGPERGRLAQLDDGFQVADAAVGRVDLAEQRLQLFLREVFGHAAPRRFRQHAAIDDPLADARQADAHQPAAALNSAPAERDAHAERHQIAADVVDGRNRQQARPGAGARISLLGLRHPAHGLHDAVEAAAAAPRTALAPGAERSADDARTQPGEILGREAAPVERAGAVGLRKDMCPGDQGAKRIDALVVSQIHVRGALADSGVELDQSGMRQVGGADLEHVGAMLGEALGAGRAGEHAREIEHAHARKRPRAGDRLPWRRVADAHDLEQRLVRHGLRVGMAQPLLLAAHVPRAAARGVDGVFQRLTRPRSAGGFGLHAIGLSAQYAQRRLAMIWKIAVDADPAVLHRIEAAQQVPHRRQRLAVHAQVGGATQRDGRGARVDAYALRLGVKPCSSNPERRQRGRGRGGNAIADRQYGIIAANLDRALRRALQPCRSQNLAQGGVRHQTVLASTGKYCLPWPASAARPSPAMAFFAPLSSACACRANSIRYSMSLSAYSTEYASSGNLSGSIAFMPWLRSAKLSADPLLSASNTRVPLRPALRASDSASAIATTFWNSTMLLISFIAWPAPGAPQCVMSLPMSSSVGFSRLNTGSVAPTITESVPAAAAARVRATGASAKWIPRAAKREFRSCASATVVVLRSTT